MKTALFLSPHLDDVVFSCGGLLARLGDRGWRTVMATAFTATILPATGFALACQLDKGLGPEVDYMALRRAEDREAASILGVSDLRWLDLPEAPHRGYGSAPELFGDIRAGDDIWHALAKCLAMLLDEVQPAIVLAPLGLGGHVDHRQMIRAVHAAGAGRVAHYRDTPYAIRDQYARPAFEPGPATTVPIEAQLDRKVRAACAYASQIGFQFGGAAATEEALRVFAISEGEGQPGEKIFGNLGSDAVQP